MLGMFTQYVFVLGFKSEGLKVAISGKDHDPGNVVGGFHRGWPKVGLALRSCFSVEAAVMVQVW